MKVLSDEEENQREAAAAAARGSVMPSAVKGNDPNVAPPAAPVDSAAATGPAAPTASDDDGKRDRRLAHYAEIRRRNGAVLDKYTEWDAAHATAAMLKKELEKMQKELRRFIKAGWEQDTLAFPDDDEADDDFDPSSPDAKPAKPAGKKGEPEWKARPLSVLGLTPALVTLLEQNGIETIGQLKDHWDAGKVLTAFKGFGEEKNAKVADAWAEYSKTHQEVYGFGDGNNDEPAASDEDEDDPFGDDAPSKPQAATKSAPEPDDEEDLFPEGEDGDVDGDD